MCFSKLLKEQPYRHSPFQTAQKNSVSLRFTEFQFENLNDVTTFYVLTTYSYCYRC